MQPASRETPQEEVRVRSAGRGCGGAELGAPADGTGGGSAVHWRGLRRRRAEMEQGRGERAVKGIASKEG